MFCVSQQNGKCLVSPKQSPTDFKNVYQLSGQLLYFPQFFTALRKIKLDSLVNRDGDTRDIYLTAV